MVIAVDLRALMSGNISGVETYITRLLKNLLEIDKKNEYILYLNSAHDQKRVLENFKSPNVRTLQTKTPNRLFNALLVFLRWPKLDRVIQKRLGIRPDVFFIPDPRPAPVSRGVKKIMVAHDLAYRHFPAFFSWKTKLWYAFSSPRKEMAECSRIIAVSEATKRDLIRTYGLLSDKITVIHEGIDENFSSEGGPSEESIRKKYLLPAQYFLFLSTLEPRKNISRLVEGYKLFAKKHPRAGIKLVLAGKTNTSVFSNFRIDKDENIILPGFIDDKDKPLLYEMAEAFVYPSLFEGFGLPLLEALKCGTPIITSDRSSMPEVVGDAALLVNPENSTAIAGALEKILQHDVRSALRRKMAERIKLFSWKKTAKQTLEVLNS